MTNYKIKSYLEWTPIIVMAVLFNYLVFNMGDIEMWIYENANLKLGQIGRFDIPQLTNKFLIIAGLSSVISIVVGLAVGIFCFTRIGREFRPVIESLATVIRTFPELAMLRFVIPLLGLGVFPTVIAISAHGVLPIIFATVSGIENIDDEYKKVSKGLGMTNFQVMTKIQLPLAAPVIISGLRVSLISCIGGATLGSATGAEGLGVLLNAGMETYNVVLIFEVAILTCLLSLITDRTLLKIEDMLTVSGRQG